MFWIILLNNTFKYLNFYFSNPTKISHFLSSLEKIVLQLKDDKILSKVISELCELRGLLNDEMIKQINLTLVSILTQYPKPPSEHDTVLESILHSIIKEGDISNKHEYYKKYLRVLYKLDKLSLLLIEAAKMHEFFPQDIYPLGKQNYHFFVFLFHLNFVLKLDPCTLLILVTDTQK